MSVKMTSLLVLALLIAVPIVEISLFIQVGSLIGLWPTILLIILTAIIGTTLLQLQGQAVFLQAKESLHQHQFPARSVLEGIMLLVCGLLLLTPGFLTDVIGFLLLLPPLRHMLIALLLNKAQAGLSNTSPPTEPSAASLDEDKTIIEGEFRDL